MTVNVDDLLNEWSGGNVSKKTTKKKTSVDILDEWVLLDPNYKPKSFMDRVNENPVVQTLRNAWDNLTEVEPGVSDPELDEFYQKFNSTEPLLKPSDTPLYPGGTIGKQTTEGKVLSKVMPIVEPVTNAAKAVYNDLAASSFKDKVDALNTGIEIGVNQTISGLQSLIETPLAAIGETPVGKAINQKFTEWNWPLLFARSSDPAGDEAKRLSAEFMNRPDLTETEKLLMGGVTNIPQMFIGGAAGKVAGGAARASKLAAPVAGAVEMLPFGAIAAGGYAKEAAESGATPTQQLLYGSIMGTVEGLTEKIPLGNVDNIMKTPFRRALVSYLKNIPDEYIQEYSTELIDGMVTTMIYNQDELLTNGKFDPAKVSALFKRAGEAGKMGAVTGIMAGTPGMVVQGARSIKSMIPQNQVEVAQSIIEPVRNQRNYTNDEIEEWIKSNVNITIPESSKRSQELENMILAKLEPHIRTDVEALPNEMDIYERIETVKRLQETVRKMREDAGDIAGLQRLNDHPFTKVFDQLYENHFGNDIITIEIPNTIIFQNEEMNQNAGRTSGNIEISRRSGSQIELPGRNDQDGIYPAVSSEVQHSSGSESEANTEQIAEQIKPIQPQKVESVSSFNQEPSFEYITNFAKRVKSGEVTAQEVKDHFKFMMDNQDTIKQSILDHINNSDKYKKKRKDTKIKLVNDTFERELERLVYAGGDTFRWSPFEETRTDRQRPGPSLAKKQDLAKLEAAVKEAGFKDIDEAYFAFQAKKNGVDWYKQQEKTSSGKGYAELISKLDKLPEDQKNKLEFNLQFFAKEDNKIPIEERNYELVSKRHVRAYQQLHPELAEYIQAEAIRIIGELSDTIKGEIFVTGKQGEETVVTSVPKMTSETIQRIQDATGASYAKIGEALESIAKGIPGINTALAKKIELIIDDNLTNGVTDFYGNKVEPDEAYKFAKQTLKPITDTELYDSKQLEKVKAKYEARIKKMKEADRAKFERQLSIIKYEANEKLKAVKQEAKEKIDEVKGASEKAIHRVKYQEMFRRLLQEKELKANKAEAIKNLREAFKKREEHRKEVAKEKREEARELNEQRRIQTKLINNIKDVRSKLNKMRPEFQRPVKALLDEINLVKPTKKTINKLNRISQYLERNPDCRLPKEVIQRLKTLGRKNIRDFSLEELRILHDSVLHYVHLNILKNKLIMNQRYKEAAEIRNDAINRIRKLRFKRTETPGYIETSRPKSDPNPLTKFHKLQLNGETLTQILDGEKNGTLYKVFYEGADEGRNLELSVHFGAKDIIDAGLKEADIKPESLMPWSEYFNTRKKAVDYITVKLESGQNFTFTKGERLAFYLHSLNDNNRQSIIKGGIYPDKNKTLKIKITEKDLETIVSGMTKEEKAVAGIFHKLYNEFSKEKLNERSLALDGFERADVENYYPKKTPELEKNYDPLKPRDNPYARFTTEGQGFLKSRTGATKDYP